MNPNSPFVVRSYQNEDLCTARDIIAANRKSRRYSFHTKVYKRTSEGDVLMSYTGPRDHTLR